MERIELAIGIVLVLWRRLLMALHLAKLRDGWRRGAGIALRGQEATFVLSAFGLSANEKIVKDCLEQLLSDESAYHLAIQADKYEDWVVPQSTTSFTWRCEGWQDGWSRFVRPDTWQGVVHGLAPDKVNQKCLFNFVVRAGVHDVCDVWMRVNHVGIDGVLAQELLSKLEKALGKGEVIFPGFEQFQTVMTPKVVEGRPQAIELQLFLDLRPLVEWRRQQNARLNQNMTLSAALLWWLATHDAFRQLRMGTTVDLAANEGCGRGVGVIVIRPGAFLKQPDGLALYVQQFNQQLEQTRSRQDAGTRTLNAAAALPARFERALLRHALRSNTAFGHLGLTVLRNASVFGAPIADVGHDHGFIALGNVSLPTESGAPVASITVKGEAVVIDNYVLYLHQALYDGPAGAVPPPDSGLV